jgi:hypothetical protein
MARCLAGVERERFWVRLPGPWDIAWRGMLDVVVDRLTPPDGSHTGNLDRAHR